MELKTVIWMDAIAASVFPFERGGWVVVGLLSLCDLDTESFGTEPSHSFKVL